MRYLTRHTTVVCRTSLLSTCSSLDKLAQNKFGRFLLNVRVLRVRCETDAASGRAHLWWQYAVCKGDAGAAKSTVCETLDDRLTTM